MKIASNITSSGTSFAPASIMITFSLVDATVNARSETSFCAEVGLITNSPSISPTIVDAVGPSNGMSEIAVAIAEPMLGEVGEDVTVINDDKKAVAQAITDEACKEAGYDSMEAAAEDGTAFVFMGHGTSHTANVTYDQMQSQMDNLGFTNAFIGTVEGEPEDTECQAVIAKVKDAGFKKVVLRPLMVVAGDHANNDMAGDDDDSWKSQFNASGAFDSVDCQIAGLGRIEAVEDLYVEHTKAAIDSLGTADTAEETTDDTAEAADDTTDGAEEVTDDSAAE